MRTVPGEIMPNAIHANGPLVDVPACTYNFAGPFIRRDNFHLVARTPFAVFRKANFLRSF